MPDRSKLSIKHGLPLLRSAADRNLPVELHVFNREGDFFVAKARILATDNRLIYLDQPQSIEKAVRFTAGRDVEVYMLCGQKIYTFRSKVVETGCVVTLNSRQSVEGISIAKPSAIDQGQRRHDVRVSLAAIDPITVHVYEEVNGSPSKSSNAKRLQARLVNLSRSGCGVLVEAKQRGWLKLGTRVFVGFQLPHEDEGSIFQAELRQTHRVLSGRAVRLGLRFLNWPHKAYLARTLRPVERFIAQRQRVVARRRSSIG